MISASEAAAITRSAALIGATGEAFGQALELRVRSAAPDFMAACDKHKVSGPELARLIVAAMLEDPQGRSPRPALLAFDQMRRDTRALPRHDVILGQALMASLNAALGADFSEPLRAGWANAYVSLVEQAIALRRNRMDFVA